MAGGRPEYLPVLVAAVEAFLDPESGSEQLQAASGSAFPGGDRQRADRPGRSGSTAGFGCLGPDPQHPAGASIGRALRLMQQNVGGALPGVGTMANYGGLRYTNVVFAEDEDEPAAGLAAPRHGASRLRARAATRSRWPSPTAPPTSGGAARRRRRPRRTRSRACTAWRTSCACPTWPGSPATSTARPGILMIPRRGRADDGRSRLDQALDPRVPLGALADPGRASAPRRRPLRGSRSTRARWRARASSSIRGRSPPSPTTSS